MAWPRWEESKHPRSPKGTAQGGEFASSGGSPNWDSGPNWSGGLFKVSAPTAPTWHTGPNWNDPSPGKNALRDANLIYSHVGVLKNTTFREPKTITPLHDLQLKGLADGFKEMETKTWGKTRVPRKDYEFPDLTVVLADGDDASVHQALVAISVPAKIMPDEDSNVFAHHRDFDENPCIVINTNRNLEKEFKDAAALSEDELFGSTSVAFRRAVEVYKKTRGEGKNEKAALEAAVQEEAKVYAVTAYVAILVASLGSATHSLLDAHSIKGWVLQAPGEVRLLEDIAHLNTLHSTDKLVAQRQRKERAAYKKAHPGGAWGEWRALSEKEKVAAAGDWLRANVSGKAAADWAAGDLAGVAAEAGTRYMVERMPKMNESVLKLGGKLDAKVVELWSQVVAHKRMEDGTPYSLLGSDIGKEPADPNNINDQQPHGAMNSSSPGWWIEQAITIDSEGAAVSWPINPLGAYKHPKLFRPMNERTIHIDIRRPAAELVVHALNREPAFTCLPVDAIEQAASGVVLLG